MEENEKMKRAWLNPKEASKYIGVSEQTLAKRRMAGLPPKFSKPVGKIYYFIEDLDAYMRGE